MLIIKIFKMGKGIHLLIFKKVHLFVWVELGLCCGVWASSSCGQWQLLFFVVRGLLIAVASPVGDHRLEGAWTSAGVTCRLSCCSLRALEHGLSSRGTQA